jgi:hypothetical protein
MKIVVGGYIVAFPLGGMTWHHLNYLLSLHALGHEVMFLEDSGEYTYPYNPRTWSMGVDSTYGRAYLEQQLSAVGLRIPWCYYSQFEDRYHGCSREELCDFLHDADAMIFVSGVTPLRADRPKPKRTCVIDTDPVFTQLRMSRDPSFLDYYRHFDRVATFGRLIGRASCALPTHDLDWIPTHQPIALDQFPTSPRQHGPFSTIGKWEHSSDRHVDFAGKTYLSSKGVEWLKLLDLPRHTHARLELAMTSMPGDHRALFESHGWTLADAEDATESCESFRRFITRCDGEFTVAKQIYSGLPSGWFSDRSACFLASGRPVVTQSSGFEKWLPTGRGLFAFDKLEDAATALDAILADYDLHSREARRIAEEYFDGKKVMSELLNAIA